MKSCCNAAALVGCNFCFCHSLALLPSRRRQRGSFYFFKRSSFEIFICLHLTLVVFFATLPIVARVRVSGSRQSCDADSGKHTAGWALRQYFFCRKLFTGLVCLLSSSSSSRSYLMSRSINIIGLRRRMHFDQH